MTGQLALVERPNVARSSERLIERNRKEVVGRAPSFASDDDGRSATTDPHIASHGRNFRSIGRGSASLDDNV